MPNQDFRDVPEYRAATGFPIAVILLSIFGIFGHLVAGGVLTEKSHLQARVYVPLATATMPIKH
ncbi:hypothetical protein [Rhizobium tubonense]|uniref:Uncharacterized protein n=1 Tax=Rhizobium tubonense TaxID=484088 RepID=A0A2W4DXL0_9HYPH|nr:hypothetical protein [Rhizobium tubonense]PZM08606.1 hypothetical protein CPY51_28410 [Rhizobium tubonense]